VAMVFPEWPWCSESGHGVYRVVIVFTEWSVIGVAGKVSLLNASVGDTGRIYV